MTMKIENTNKLKIDNIVRLNKQTLIEIKRDGKYGCIDRLGNEIIPAIYDDIQIREKHVEVGLNVKFGLFDENGVELVPLIYDYLEVFPDYELIEVSFNDIEKNKFRFGIIDLTSKLIIEIKYDRTNVISTNLIAVKLNDKWGIYDRKGEVVLPIEYDVITNYFDGICYIQKDGKYGFFNPETIEKIILPKYDSISYFKSSLFSIVKLNNKLGLIDKKGNEIIPLQFEEIVACEIEYHFLALQNNQYGLLQLSKKEKKAPNEDAWGWKFITEVKE